MSIKLVVNVDSQIEEYRESAHKPKSKFLLLLAKIISYVFHPLFVPVYIILFLINFQPGIFAGVSALDKMRILFMFIMMYSFFPLVTILLAKGLGFLDSLYLKTQKDRIIPYIACNIYYFWISYVLRNQPEFSGPIVQLAMAIFIASSIGLLVNIFMKVSMHAISMGVMVVFMGVLAATQAANFTTYISITLLVAGVVCTARLIVSDHTTKEVYIGLLVGGISQLLAVWADGILP